MPARVREALLGGFAASRVLEVHGERILTATTSPASARSSTRRTTASPPRRSRRIETPAPVSAAVHQLVTALIASGRGADDYSALAKVVFELAGLEATDSADQKR